VPFDDEEEKNYFPDFGWRDKKVANVPTWSEMMWAREDFSAWKREIKNGKQFQNRLLRFLDRLLSTILDGLRCGSVEDWKDSNQHLNLPVQKTRKLSYLDNFFRLQKALFKKSRRELFLWARKSVLKTALSRIDTYIQMHICT
jgi:hypothetical protein